MKIIENKKFVGKNFAEQYAGFGQYIKLPVPLRVTPSYVWTHKKQMYMHRLWKFVTCKNCLRLRAKLNQQASSTDDTTRMHQVNERNYGVHMRLYAILVIAALAIAGCNQQNTPLLETAVCNGSGCTAFGCGSHAKIISGRLAGRTYTIENTKIVPGDTLLVVVDTVNGFCSLYK